MKLAELKAMLEAALRELRNARELDWASGDGRIAALVDRVLVLLPERGDANK